MKCVKLLVYGLLTIAFLFIWVVIVLVLSSQRIGDHPWHRPFGVEFLFLLLCSCPASAGIGVGHVVLGLFMPTTRLTKVLPFVAAAVAFSPFCLVRVHFVGETLALCGAAMVILCLSCAVNDLRRFLGQKERVGTEEPGRQGT